MYHIPNGDACQSCTRLGHDCTRLDFKAMPVIRVSMCFAVVRCTQYEPDQRELTYAEHHGAVERRKLE